eukprot:scaffold196669_cov28-Tisochrysis_lutea.AAC.3
MPVRRAGVDAPPTSSPATRRPRRRCPTTVRFARGRARPTIDGVEWLWRVLQHPPLECYCASDKAPEGVGAAPRRAGCVLMLQPRNNPENFHSGLAPATRAGHSGLPSEYRERGNLRAAAGGQRQHRQTRACLRQLHAYLQWRLQTLLLPTVAGNCAPDEAPRAPRPGQ